MPPDACVSQRDSPPNTEEAGADRVLFVWLLTIIGVPEPRRNEPLLGILMSFWQSPLHRVSLACTAKLARPCINRVRVRGMPVARL